MLNELIRGVGGEPRISYERNDDIEVTTVGNEEELFEIKALQLANSKSALTVEEMEQEGFVTAQYTIEFLKKMHSFAPSVIAKDKTKPIGSQVVGYVIVTTRDIAGEHELLDDLFRACDQVKYFDAKSMTWRYMKDVNYTLSGQLCVAKGYRHRGLVARMYHHYRDVMQNFHIQSFSLKSQSVAANKPVEYCLTDVATSNPRSVKAHLKAGFEIVETLIYANVDWYIVLLHIQQNLSSTSLSSSIDDIKGRKNYDVTLLNEKIESVSDREAAKDLMLFQIRVLQLNNSKHLLCREEQEREGYVTAQYPVNFLKAMHSYTPAVIATVANTNRIVGYALATTKDIEGQNEAMDSFFNVVKTINYDGKPLDSLKYIVCGQLCISKGHRGKELVKDMYDYMIEKYRDRYDYLVTDVSQSNARSLRAHLRYGFEVIATLPYASDVWYIILKRM